MNPNLVIAIAFLLLALEKFGTPIPPIVTGIVLLVAAVLLGLFR